MTIGLASDGDRRNERGFLVVAVLWILAVLSALMLIYLTYVTNTAMVVARSVERVQSEALIAAGVELAAYRLAGEGDDAPPASGRFMANVGAGKIAVTFQSEAARIDLNAAPREVLAGLMTGLGVARSDATSYADRILAWRAPTRPGEGDPEDSFYRVAGVSYLPRHAPFPHADELRLVRGIPPALVEQMLPFVTVFSGRASVDTRDAAPQVIAALPGMTPERLQSVLSRRVGLPPDPQFGPERDGDGNGETTRTVAYRLAIEVEINGARRNGAEIVILPLESGEQPYRILSWRQEADGAMLRQRTVRK